MSRKDYKLIADVLSEAMPQPDWTAYEAQLANWQAFVVHMSHALKDDNPRFLRSKFYKTCGYIH